MRIGTSSISLESGLLGRSPEKWLTVRRIECLPSGWVSLQNVILKKAYAASKCHLMERPVCKKIWLFTRSGIIWLLSQGQTFEFIQDIKAARSAQLKYFWLYCFFQVLALKLNSCGMVGHRVWMNPCWLPSFSPKDVSTNLANAKRKERGRESIGMCTIRLNKKSRKARC